MRLADKVILVTGGCTGIGRAIAKRGAEEGAQLVINGLEEEAGQELVRELGTEKATLFIADITKPEVPEQLVQRALQTFGRLDVVVNNAAYIDFSNIKTSNERADAPDVRRQCHCAAFHHSGRFALPQRGAGVRAQYRFGQCLVRRPESAGVQYVQRCADDHDAQPGRCAVSGVRRSGQSDQSGLGADGQRKTDQTDARCVG